MDGGAGDVCGGCLIFEIGVELGVLVGDYPDWYVGAPPVYPPSILVLDPLTLLCEFAGYAGSTKNANALNININIAVNL